MIGVAELRIVPFWVQYLVPALSGYKIQRKRSEAPLARKEAIDHRRTRLICHVHDSDLVEHDLDSKVGPFLKPRIVGCFV